MSWIKDVNLVYVFLKGSWEKWKARICDKAVQCFEWLEVDYFFIKLVQNLSITIFVGINPRCKLGKV